MYDKQKLERKEERAKYREKVLDTKIRNIRHDLFQYKLEPTPDPTDEEEDSEEEEEEEDDLFGGGGKGADDPAAQAASIKMSIH